MTFVLNIELMTLNTVKLLASTDKLAEINRIFNLKNQVLIKDNCIKSKFVHWRGEFSQDTFFVSLYFQFSIGLTLINHSMI